MKGWASAIATGASLACLFNVLANPDPGSNTFAGPVRLSLPPIIYAVPGIETNVYFDNVVLVVNPTNYIFDVKCEKGFLLDERWTFTPEEDDSGDFPFILEVRDASYQIIARGASTVRVARSTAGSGLERTILMAGASLTEASIYPAHFLNLSRAAGNPRIRMVGSRGPGNLPASGDVRHEGYSGWTAEAFVVLSGPLSRTGLFKRPETGSPFVYLDSEGEPVLDFARYCREFNEGQGPDFLTLFLGPNDVFTATDGTIDARIDRMFGFYDQLIQAVHRHRFNTRIGIVLPITPAAEQYGFRNYRGPGRQTYWQYRRNLHRLIERLLEIYGGREQQHVYLIPVYSNIDTVHGYPRHTVRRNAQTAEMVSRTYNGTHPSPEGYRQIGDSIFCWFKSLLE